MRKKMAKKKAKYRAGDWDESKSLSVVPEPQMQSGVSTSIRLPKDMLAKLRRVAKKKGDVGYQTLLKIWIAERLEKELA